MLFYWFQQTGAALRDTVANAAPAVKASGNKANSIWDTLQLGGWIMIPLGLLFLLTIFFFFERLLTIRKGSKIDDNFMNLIRDHITNGNVVAARSMAKNTNNPVARMINKGLQRIGKPIDYIEKSMESVANLELYNMEKNLNILGMIAYVAPMFGFLGTIIGMFQLFFDLGKGGEFDIATVSNGIYVKMISSATGIIVGLLAYVGNKVLGNLVERNANKMEIASAEFLDILQEPSHK
jgi:biopolymer transport protein ExbB